MNGPYTPESRWTEAARLVINWFLLKSSCCHEFIYPSSFLLLFFGIYISAVMRPCYMASSWKGALLTSPQGRMSGFGKMDLDVYTCYGLQKRKKRTSSSKPHDYPNGHHPQCESSMTSKLTCTTYRFRICAVGATRRRCAVRTS